MSGGVIIGSAEKRNITGDDGRILSITAETGVYRIRLDAAGF
jgi:hypothetical protein